MNSLLTHDQIIYSLDTSALIAAFHERYPIENFPSLWDKIEELIKNGRLKMSQIVFDEAMRDTKIKQWCNENQLKPDFQAAIDESVKSSRNFQDWWTIELENQGLTRGLLLWHSPMKTISL